MLSRNLQVMSLCVAREMVVPMAMEAKAAREVMFINMLTAITITNDINYNHHWSSA